MTGEVLTDFGFEIDFFVECAHADSIDTKLRTSIWPVTAAEIKAVRRSLRRSIT